MCSGDLLVTVMRVDDAPEHFRKRKPRALRRLLDLVDLHLGEVDLLADHAGLLKGSTTHSCCARRSLETSIRACHTAQAGESPDRMCLRRTWLNFARRLSRRRRVRLTTVHIVRTLYTTRALHAFLGLSLQISLVLPALLELSQDCLAALEIRRVRRHRIGQPLRLRRQFHSAFLPHRHLRLDCLEHRMHLGLQSARAASHRENQK